MRHVYLTHVPVILVGTVNVSAPLWLPMLNPVIKLVFVYNGGLLISAVSNQDKTFLHFYFMTLKYTVRLDDDSLMSSLL